MKGNRSKQKSEKKKLEKKNEKKERTVQCKNCLFYDWTSEREFRRDGIREGLIEIRGICRCEKVRSYNRLVMAKKENVKDSDKENTNLQRNGRRRIVEERKLI